MPVYADFSNTQAPPEPSPPLRSRDVCDWLVVPHVPGSVMLCTPHFQAPGMSVTFTRAALPQLRQIVQLLEKAS